MGDDLVLVGSEQEPIVLVEYRECDMHLYLKCACALLSFPSREGPINSRMGLATHNAKYEPTSITLDSLPLVSRQETEDVSLITCYIGKTSR